MQSCSVLRLPGRSLPPCPFALPRPHALSAAEAPLLAKPALPTCELMRAQASCRSFVMMPSRAIAFSIATSASVATCGGIVGWVVRGPWGIVGQVSSH